MGLAVIESHAAADARRLVRLEPHGSGSLPVRSHCAVRSLVPSGRRHRVLATVDAADIADHLMDHLSEPLATLTVDLHSPVIRPVGIPASGSVGRKTLGDLSGLMA